jgi:hypothetical protein
MENNNTLKDVALMCECSEKVSSFGILADFMKRAVMDYYSYRAKGAEMPTEEKELFAAKYNQLQDFLKDCELHKTNQTAI